MKLKEHLEIIDNPVVLELKEQDGTVLYHGYKGCFEHEEVNNEKITDREVIRFHLKVEGKRKTNEADRQVFTELNCGTFNYTDFHMSLVYMYILE